VGTRRWPVLTSQPIFHLPETPHGHFLSSACGHNKDVFYRRVELTRRGHNFNCAAGAVGSFYLGRRPHPNGFFAASDCLENGSSESETGVVLRRSCPRRPPAVLPWRSCREQKLLALPLTFSEINDMILAGPSPRRRGFPR